MAIIKQPFGKIKGDIEVTKYTVEGKGGLSVSVLDYGATLQSIMFDGKDMILGYNDAESYTKAGGYLGATVGRYANRIAGGDFTLNGVAYHITVNEKGVNHLHGGDIGFDKKIWVMETVDDTTLTATTTAADGEEGYPGNMTVKVTFSVSDDNTFTIRYDAETDKDTVASFTNHAYFNVSGDEGDTIYDTKVQVFADAYTPVGENLIPIGIRKVDGTPFDLREETTFGEVVLSEHPEIAACNGLDHNFVLAMEQGTYRPAMRAESPKTGIAVTCYTDMPGIQIYTTNGPGAPFGKHGPIGQHQGFCMETQFFPDSPNHPDFPSCVIKAGEPFTSVTAYKFEKVN